MFTERLPTHLAEGLDIIYAPGRSADTVVPLALTAGTVVVEAQDVRSTECLRPTGWRLCFTVRPGVCMCVCVSERLQAVVLFLTAHGHPT